jgi:hypothetical protein
MPLDLHVREFEIASQFSLARLDPLALVELRRKGECDLWLPEALFDSEYPGHYMRRLKSVSLTVPFTAGPYTGENATITLVSNKVRMTTSPSPQYPEQGPDDPRFAYSVGAIQSVATSTAHGDSRLFEMSVRDERYLPFEGAGAISQWHLDMRAPNQQFDFSTISDVIFHLRYTARDGSATLRKWAVAATRASRKPPRPPSK